MKKIFPNLYKAVITATILVLFPGIAGATKTLNNPLSKDGTGGAVGLADLVGRIIGGVLGITGVLAMLFVVLGGVNLIIGYSQGSEEKVGKAKKTILFAVLGVIIAFGGYVIINVVLSRYAELLGWV